MMNLIDFVPHLQQKQTKLYETIALFTQLPNTCLLCATLLLMYITQLWVRLVPASS